MSETISKPNTPPPGETAPAASVTSVTPVPRRRGQVMRLAGNLLIVVGVVLLVSVGGYLGIQAYQNNQEAQRIEQENKDLPLSAPNLPRETPAAQPTTAGTALPGVNPPAPTAAPASSGLIVANVPVPNVSGGGSVRSAPVHTDPPTRINIPSVGIDSKVVEVGWQMLPGKDGQNSAQWEVADYAVGHNQGSANPGEIGNVVMSGHVDWKGEVFRNLHKVQRGDEVQVYSGDREYLYIVQGIVKVKEEGSDVTDEMRRQNAAYMNPTPDQTLTLITCWPYGVDDYRLIVIAKPYDSGISSRPDLVLK